MGIKGAHLYTHSVSGVSIGELYQIGLNRKKINTESADINVISTETSPTIDIDASWVFRSSTVNVDNRITWMIHLALELSKTGFIVNFICDGNERHHSKRATIDRKSKYQRLVITGYVKRAELMKLAEKRSDCNTTEEINMLNKEEITLSKKIKIIETQQQSSNLNVGNEFFDNLKIAINQVIYLPKDTHKGKIFAIQAKFQADSVLAYRCLNCLSEVVMSADSDLAALCGSFCLGIKSFKFIDKNKTDCLSQIVLYTPSSNTLRQVIDSIYLQYNNTRIKRSNYDIFDNIDDIKIRGLLAVGLGCDVYLSGVEALGKSNLYKYLKKESNLTYDTLLNFYYDFLLQKNLNKQKRTNIKNKISDTINDISEDSNIENINRSKIEFIDAMNIYVDAFIHEPSNWFPNEATNEVTKYSTNVKPRRLHEYLTSFANDDSDIEIYKSVNTLVECSGSGSGSHIFLSFESKYNCIVCKNKLCKYCCIIEVDKQYCYDCYLTEITVVPLNVVQQPSLNIMRSTLTELGIETGADDNIADISDIFEAVTEQKKYEIYINNQFVNDINVPLQPSNYLDNELVIFRFDLRNGGGFIRHDQCTLVHKFDIIILLSKLVQTGNSDYKNVKIYSILPDLICDFAKRARLHSGYRLLKRAVRHSMDPEGCSILNSNCCIIQYNNQTGIHISHVIKASMKTDSYNVKVSFTSTDIISVSCTCKAGSCNEEKVICVHILPVILQFSLLLFDGLAEHILCELANDLPPSVEDCFREEDANKLKDAIILLKRANTDICNEELNRNLSINDLLKKYRVGTEVYKKGPGPPKDVKKLGPLRNLSFVSPLFKVERIMKKKATAHISDTLHVDDNNLEPINQIDIIPYTIIQELIDFVSHALRKQITKRISLDDYLGFKLLKYRANKINESTETIHNMNLLKKKLMRAMTDACKEFRNIRKLKSNNTLSNIIPQKLHNDAEIDVVGIEKDNELTIHKTLAIKQKRLTCCAVDCKNTSTKFPDLKFMQIPKIPSKIIFDQSTEKRIKTYHRKMFLRKEWMKRLGLANNTPNQYLKICEQHPLEIQEIDFIYKNKLNKDTLTSHKMRLPSNLKDPPLKTRQQHQKRKVIHIDTNTCKRPRKSCNTKDSLTSIKKKKIRKYCHYVGCCMNDSDLYNDVKFSRIPSKPKCLKDNPTNKQILQFTKKTEFHKLFCRATGINVNDDRKELRICNKHKITTVRQLLHWTDNKNKQQSTKVLYNLPSIASQQNIKNIFEKENKGLGIDRFLCNTINSAKDKIKEKGNEYLEWAYVVQQTYAANDENVHHSVAKAVGLEMQKSPDVKYEIQKTNKNIENEKTIIRFNLIDDTTIKSQTGFENKQSLLCYIIIVCNGCVDTMIKKKSKLTWFEEWYFFLEKCYSHSISRWRDYEDKYKRSGFVLRIIYDEKMRMVLTCRERWPRYVSLNEDEDLRNECWNNTYGGKRIVMWDNTCIRLPKPQDPEAQRNTYSAYYAGNVGKGAIFIQLCGWMGTHELWEGAVSDSEYFIRSGILEQQQKYVTIYDNDNIDVQWFNILDKGYRVTNAAWRSGRQFVLQPSFAKSDKKFSGLETLRSAAIASDRGANERAVRLSKMSKQLSEGRTGNKSIERLSDLWITWSFQCNFIYKPVL